MFSIKSIAIALLVAASPQLAQAQISLYTITSLTLASPGGLDKSDPHMTFMFRVGNSDEYVVCDSTYKAGSEPQGGQKLPCLTEGYSWQYATFNGFYNMSLELGFSNTGDGGDASVSATTPVLESFDDNVFFACRDQGVCILSNKVPIQASIN